MGAGSHARTNGTASHHIWRDHEVSKPASQGSAPGGGYCHDSFPKLSPSQPPPPFVEFPVPTITDWTL